MPLFNALQNPTIPKDSIENTLYANIKLKKMLDEYFQTQQRAREILKDINSSENTFLPSTKAPTMAIPKLQAEASMEFRGLIEFISKETQKAETQKKHQPETARIAGSENSQNVSATFNETSIKNPYFNNTLPPTKTFRKETRQHPKGSSLFYDDVELPWIIKAPLQALSYLMAHALESAILGVGIIILISIFSSLRSQKQ